MTYIRLEDGFFRNPKARAMGKDGRALYIAGLCHCSDGLTDGYISAHVVPVLLVEAEAKQAAVRQLVSLGVWREAEGGYRVHDYLRHQRSREQVERQRRNWRQYKAGLLADSNGDSA